MTRGATIRVLVVDDSAFARKVLRESLRADGDIEVVGTAGDGLEALEKISELTPDVVTLDLVMPNLDGLGVLRELQSSRATVRVVVVSMSDSQSEIVIEALQLGAVDFVKKPTALPTEMLYELSKELVAKVKHAAGARVSVLPPAAEGHLSAATTSRVKLVVVGTSTGGPHALTRLLSTLPKSLPVPLAMALHIPAEYTQALAKRLNDVSALQVIEAAEKTALPPGTAVLAKGGAHLTIEREGARPFACIDRRRREGLYTPSVDVLFSSAAERFGSETLGVVLTGMGDDGLAGSRAIVEAGGRVLTEAEASCVVYGMPRCVEEAGLSARAVPLESMASAILQHL